MAFLLHLAIIVGGLIALVAFIAAPRKTLFWGAVLTCGYLGSPDGFGGTCLGLLIGAGVGGVLAGLFHVVATLWRWTFNPDPPEKKAPGTPDASGSGGSSSPPEP